MSGTSASPVRYAYLGPEGTFTEAALQALPPSPEGVLEPYATVPAALDAVRRGAASAAMVPLENSVEGGVAATLDELAIGEPLVITREVLLPIRFSLLARSGTRLADVKRVITHPHAEAQCRRWILANLSHAEVFSAASTAAAAIEVAAEGSSYDAAISAPIAGMRYRLETLADGIGDRSDAVTRFILVSTPDAPTEATGVDRTSLVAYIADDHPGALLEILSEFAVRGVNLTRIESRPTGEGLGKYCFSIDAEGHIADARVGEALMGLWRVCADVRFLGSYPRADGIRPTTPRGTSDGDFRDAADWLSRLRGATRPTLGH